MGENGKPAVLAVDDDAAILRLITIVLTRAGMDVEAVSSGTAAINALADRPFAAVILDLTMPLVSGFEVIAFLRHASPSTLRRVVVITAMSDSAVRRLDHSLVFSVLAKPFDIVKFEATVRRCVETSPLQAPLSDATLPIKSEDDSAVVRDDLPLGQLTSEPEIAAPPPVTAASAESSTSTPPIDEAKSGPK